MAFNADAFNMPEGSMLDALIKQLPGVELKDDGQIFVNGRKIDNLTLNGKDFFKGDNRVMLDNLPNYMVQNVEVYEKSTEKSEWLGIDVEQSVNKFFGDPPRRYRSGDGPAKMECCVFDIDAESGHCVKAEALRIL